MQYEVLYVSRYSAKGQELNEHGFATQLREECNALAKEGWRVVSTASDYHGGSSSRDIWLVGVWLFLERGENG